MLREPEKGHGSGLPFRPGSAAYRAGDTSTPDGGGAAGSGASSSRYGLVAAFEFCAAEYGWSPDYIDTHVTDEQFALYVEKAAERKRQASFAELDRIVNGTSWGVAIAFDRKGRNARKWQSLRRKVMRDAGTHEKGLTGAALETAVMALASADPSLVKIEARA